MSFFRSCLYHTFFEYNTVRYVTVKSKVLGLFNRFLFLCIGIYTFGIVLGYQKEYQEVDMVEGSITTKVKGITLTNYSKEDFQVPESHIPLYNRLWDVLEYVAPAIENEDFFVMTNAIITPNQTFGVCDEDPDVKGALCGEGLPPCQPGHTYQLGNGVATGNCINSTHKPGAKVCEIEAWCPTQYETFPLKNSKPLLEDSKYYTVLIKNRIYYPRFGTMYKRSNILLDNNMTYLKSCRYDKEKSPLCPIFEIKNIVEEAGENFTELAYKGAVISIRIVWNCDLDWDFMKYCLPQYSFHRIDNANRNLTHGWNFRHSYHHEFGRRTLIKVYGIKFVLIVQGQGGKFSVIPTMYNIGSAIGLMYLVPVICDIMMLIFLKARNEIKPFKYLILNGDQPLSENNIGNSKVKVKV